MTNTIDMLIDQLNESPEIYSIDSSLLVQVIVNLVNRIIANPQQPSDSINLLIKLIFNNNNIIESTIKAVDDAAWINYCSILSKLPDLLSHHCNNFKPQIYLKMILKHLTNFIVNTSFAWSKETSDLAAVLLDKLIQRGFTGTLFLLNLLNRHSGNKYFRKFCKPIVLYFKRKPFVLCMEINCKFINKPRKANNRINSLN